MFDAFSSYVSEKTVIKNSLCTHLTQFHNLKFKSTFQCPPHTQVSQNTHSTASLDRITRWTVRRVGVYKQVSIYRCEGGVGGWNFYDPHQSNILTQRALLLSLPRLVH